MDELQEELIQSALTAKDENDLFSSLLYTTRKLEFEFCAYGLRSPFPISQPKTVLVNNYPTDWQKRYSELKYIDCDPSVAHALTSSTPLLWTEEITRACRPFWEDAHAYGLRFGWAMPCHGNKGFKGMLTLSRSAEVITAAELSSKILNMHWLAHFAYGGMCCLHATKMVPELSSALSAREVEVLRWTAEGKTSRETSDIMNISERTVNFHAINAIRKLGTSNKTAATVKAALLGLI
jgi:LuxR family quorum-sensing system transcriptional regulator SolR